MSGGAGSKPYHSFFTGVGESLSGAVSGFWNVALATTPHGWVGDAVITRDLNRLIPGVSTWHRILKPMHESWQGNYDGLRNNNYSQAGAAFYAALPVLPLTSIGVKIGEAIEGTVGDSSSACAIGAANAVAGRRHRRDSVPGDRDRRPVR